MGRYAATTRGIEVTVEPAYLETHSNPDAGKWVWSYQVQIHNGGTGAVQLLRRRWRIIDASGRTILVEGDGVVGEQPVLEPGQTFEYTSGTPLETSSGIMSGTYHMVVLASGDTFEAEVPAFSLDSPGPARRVH